MTKKKDYSGYTLFPDGSTAKADISCHDWRSRLQGGEWVELDQQGSYEGALQAAHQRALETAKALQSDLKRLSNE